MAKLGIALGSGPRDLGLESRHSDQIIGIRLCGFRFLFPDTQTDKTGIFSSERNPIDNLRPGGDAPAGNALRTRVVAAHPLGPSTGTTQ